MRQRRASLNAPTTPEAAFSPPHPTVLVRETCGTVHIEHRFSGASVRSVVKTRARWSPLQLLHEAFLPTGFPESVSRDYVPYQLWDSAQAACSSLTGILSSRAVFKGVGVGDKDATATGAVINWMIRDGASMLGRIVFTWFEGTNLDCNAKTWRLVADILNDAAFFLEILSPSLPKALFLPVCSTAAVMKALVGVAGGASRTSLTQHQARRNNIADVAAKDGSQEMALGLFAMLLGLVITPYIETDFAVWSSFAILTGLHLYCNYNAVRVVVLERINRQRGALLINQFLSSQPLATPPDIARIEQIFYQEPRFPFSIVLGAPLSMLLRSSSFKQASIDRLQQVLNLQRYVLVGSDDGRTVSAIFHASATSLVAFKAFFHAKVLAHGEVLKREMENGFDTPNPRSVYELSLSDTSMHTTNELFREFIDQLRQRGWNTNEFLMGSDEWRCSA